MINQKEGTAEYLGTAYNQTDLSSTYFSTLCTVIGDLGCIDCLWQ
jgi:hypothetical protein